ncbi:hypothetical protein [Desulfonatronospira sp.]|uniref:hypothetical protein n=1 Tax=Desulfonatronospira sp. TaxID=1962951 RepID=UPI0025C11880|nr:hypothetical protein [Desulfonatronospira sp.]
MHLVVPGVKHIFLLGMLLTLSCTQQPEMAGVYTEKRDAASGMPSIIKLSSDHQGSWETEIDTLTFKWHIANGEIHFQTRAKDTLSGELTDTGFTIRLPHNETLEFEKTSP